jgi:hypothetical protein
MRIISDKGAPKPLATYLPGHAIKLVNQMGWSTFKNGELLFGAEAAGFELMVTTDRNLAYQRNLTSRKIAVVVLGAGNCPRIEAAIAAEVQAVERAGQGTFEKVAIP